MAKTKRPAGTPPSAPANVRSLLNSAVQMMQRGMAWQAKAQCQQILQMAPGHADAHYLLGIMAARAGQFEEASLQIGASLRSNPANPAAHNNLGVALKKQDRVEDAVASFQSAIALKADYAEAHHNLGNALRALGRFDEALVSLDTALALRPDLAEGHHARGSILACQRRFPEAIECFTRAIAAQPSSASAFADRGAALMELGRPEEAIADLDNALALDPHNVEALENRAQAATGAKRHTEAVDFYQRLYDLAPAHPFVKGNLLHARMLCCEWSAIEDFAAAIESDLAAGLPAAEPFGYQGIAQSEAALLACARVYCEQEYPAVDAALHPPLAKEGRITIGYLCGEFRQHATTILMCGVFEQHDRGKFKVIAFDNGGDDGSDYRKRAVAAFDEVVDISSLSDADAASAIRRMNVDILVNLNGYYGQERTGVFSRRPSPVQVNYLGFPGTLGAPYFDYLVADDVVIPPGSREFYTEKIAYLPHSYQANDAKRPIAGRAFDRSMAGLPPHAFVFCCFNNNYKITPATFDGWMRILRRVDNSCLWLLENNPAAARNLRQAAEARGIDGGRLVFAGHMPPADHLARHALADLFLDTLPYNAHTTASDALWAGLPVLTRTGSTFPGRVATSLLNAIGLPELVAATAQDYEDTAVRLAGDREALAALKAKLAAQRETKPLYDTALFTRNLEAAYAAMRQRHAAGEPAAHLRVDGGAPG
ncbi:MAG: tetratricopeptide repeat protein [Ramlibacter sp.]